MVSSDTELTQNKMWANLLGLALAFTMFSLLSSLALLLLHVYVNYAKL